MTNLLVDKQSATKLFKQCFALKSTEKVLILADRQRVELGVLLNDVARDLAKLSLLSIIDIGSRKPKQYLEEVVNTFDVFVLAGNISYTKFRLKLIDLGKRAATLPHVTMNVFRQMLSIDLEKMQRDADKLASKLVDVDIVKITSSAGTNITFSKKNRRVIKNDGNMTFPGSYNNIPPGEVFFSPVEGTANGTIVVDGSHPLCGLMKSPLTMHVKDGYVIDFETKDKELEGKLDRKFVKYGKNVGNIAELGIGISPVAQVIGVTLEDEKTLGTVHIAIGANSFMGGKIDIPVHLDGVILNPKIELDNQSLDVVTLLR